MGWGNFCVDYLAGMSRSKDAYCAYRGMISGVSCLQIAHSGSGAVLLLTEIAVGILLTNRFDKILCC